MTHLPSMKIHEMDLISLSEIGMWTFLMWHWVSVDNFLRFNRLSLIYSEIFEKKYLSHKLKSWCVVILKHDLQQKNNWTRKKDL
jgi:hypothetical protein